MRNHHASSAFILTSLVLLISVFSCSPKCVVRGRVVDAETQQPIRRAAVAIRWYTNDTEISSARSETIEAAQSVTDDRGVFKIPEYPDQKYTLGVYKNGYICWSSQDIFAIEPGPFQAEIYRRRENHQIKEGMQIELEPLHKSHSKDLHAGFVVMVAGESTESDSGPFHQAIHSEYELWRENLRRDFRKQVGSN